MKVIQGRDTSKGSVKRSETNVGEVWGDSILPTSDGITVNMVWFAPGARTHWHRHERGQILHVTVGGGWVCKDGEEAQRIRTGDIVWIAPGERHWHGAASDSIFGHIAISVDRTDWEEQVSAKDYAGC
ncbi:cupin domain-containing protein (plasmid) [Marinobacter sp. M3C]|jgi:quercetin dioxygenase-like cupin family protein|uniref:cupin domain-containing protein n=1 Tax=Marinobacter sp. M3C TaxID=2917715 RepID=UPI00200BB040|nr:cupin domain-containing protein [Marinobacter sp. M3C]UQG62677.1 cupin domain-containing protein [Marinobacter sp. M3C]